MLNFIIYGLIILIAFKIIGKMIKISVKIALIGIVILMAIKMFNLPLSII
ncbi:MAG: hypothetical protein AB7G87_14485 [Clostridia bacterium]